MNTSLNYIQGSLFEEDYLIRSLGVLAHSNDVALTELVANAWDAGASLVKIIIPDHHDEKLVIEDDGIGLTSEQFHCRWMKLGYDRVKHQGKKVQFPKGKNGSRLAYGRNGVGRHGLLCFNDEYTVITRAEGKKSTFIVHTLSESQPFVLKEEFFDEGKGHGTRLEVTVNRNLPKPDRILEIISARFLHDPQFVIKINGNSVPLEGHVGLIDTKKIEFDGISLTLHFIDSQKSAKTTKNQGIAFWQYRRLVGEPSWSLGNEIIIDGRYKFAKKYTVVVETDDLADYVLEDWTGFKKHEIMDKVYACVSEYVKEMFKNIAHEYLEETKAQVKQEYRESLRELSPLGKYEVNEAIDSIINQDPTARPEYISLAVEAIINLEKTRTGKALLQKISQLSDEDIAGLDRLLGEWTIKDALCVLDEIDRRISIIEAIKKLSGDKNIDELKILHPLITEARWLFGPEFDSPEYIVNRQLKTVVKEIFNVEIGTEVFENHRKRPDLVIKGDSTFSFTGTERFYGEPTMITFDRILIIELKRGGFKLGRKERNQAYGYVEDFIGCGSNIGNPFIQAFVVGENISGKLQPITSVENAQEVEQGKIRIVTYGQLVDTAERRLFRLREKLNERYDNIPGLELFEKAKQLELDIK